jgi:signal transduction histidine kinase/ActR/RegA family two-component response regulator
VSARSATVDGQRNEEFLEALNETMLDLLDRRDLPDLLRALLSRIAALMGAPTVEVLTKDGDHLEIRASVASIRADPGRRVRRDEAPISWRAVESRKPVVVSDYTGHPDAVPRLTSLLALPIIRRQEVMGVIVVARTASDPGFTDVDVRHGEMLARLVALALHNAATHSDAVREAAERTLDLQRSEERLAFALDATSGELWDWDITSGVVHVSPKLAEMIGPVRDETATRFDAFLAAVHEDDVAGLRQSLDEHLAGRTPVARCRVRMRLPGREPRWFLSRGKVVARTVDGSPLRLVGTIVDISERIASEAANAEALGTLRATLESTADGILTIAANGDIASFNRPFVEMWRIPDEVLESRIDQRALAYVIEQLVDPADFLDKVQYLYGHPLEESFDVLHFKDGRTFERYSRPMMIGDQPSGRVWSFRDVTARRQAEERKAALEVQLQAALKLESVGRLAGGVAHDFNNMLGVIIGHAEMARDRATESGDAPMLEHLAQVHAAATRSGELTRQLLAFARKQLVAPQALDPNARVGAIVSMLRRAVGERIAMRFEAGDEVWPVLMDPSQLDQVLTNLCLNARDAIRGDGRITLRTANCVIDDAFCAAHVMAAPGEFVRISVEDTGAGMDAETLAHLFEPFFTTKPQGEGTGLGLATVYGAVTQNHGFVVVRSAPGDGATFSLYLPRLVGTVGAAAPADKAPDAVPGGTETLLLVEDEPAIRTVIARALKRRGYSVLVAAGPSEALDIAASQGGAIDLLLTDVIMPTMSGKELAHAMLSAHPTTRVVYMSGYTADIIGHDGVLGGELRFLAKPFTLDELALTVRSALDASA